MSKFKKGDRVYHRGYYGMTIKTIYPDGWIDCDCPNGDNLHFHSKYAAKCPPVRTPPEGVPEKAKKKGAKKK